ncbi:MAG: hypothetical protein WCB11_27930, partial [Terriglobales bacterium]
VRFDEREQETEPSQAGLRRARRKPHHQATGRLKSLRLFSTLLPNFTNNFNFTNNPVSDEKSFHNIASRLLEKG